MHGIQRQNKDGWAVFFGEPNFASYIIREVGDHLNASFEKLKIYLIVYNMLPQVSVGAWCVPKLSTLTPTMAVSRLQPLEVQADPQCGCQRRYLRFVSDDVLCNRINSRVIYWLFMQIISFLFVRTQIHRHYL